MSLPTTWLTDQAAPIVQTAAAAITTSSTLRSSRRRMDGAWLGGGRLMLRQRLRR
jgi:hypothetical protein